MTAAQLQWAYRISTGLFAVLMFISGLIGLVNSLEYQALVNGHLHYPTWFPHWLGAWKIAGVLTIVAPGLPRLKEWAYAGFLISLTTAAVSHIVVGDSIVQAPAFAAIMLVLGAVSWATRPATRRL